MQVITWLCVAKHPTLLDHSDMRSGLAIGKALVTATCAHDPGLLQELRTSLF